MEGQTFTNRTIANANLSTNMSSSYLSVKTASRYMWVPRKDWLLVPTATDSLLQPGPRRIGLGSNLVGYDHGQQRRIEAVCWNDGWIFD